METKIIPTEDRVLVKIAPAETVTKGGIIIPDTASKDRPIQGVVEAVGPGKEGPHYFVATKIKPGDVVLFSKYGPEEVQFNGDTYYILSETGILAVIK